MFSAVINRGMDVLVFPIQLRSLHYTTNLWLQQKWRLALMTILCANVHATHVAEVMINPCPLHKLATMGLYGGTV